jgi:hypothetical protein
MFFHWKCVRAKFFLYHLTTIKWSFKINENGELPSNIKRNTWFCNKYICNYIQLKYCLQLPLVIFATICYVVHSCNYGTIRLHNYCFFNPLKMTTFSLVFIQEGPYMSQLVANVINLITILWVYWGPLYIGILGGIKILCNLYLNHIKIYL